MKIQDILSIDTEQLRSMDLKQLQRIVKQAQNASVRRLKAIEAKDLTLVSKAYQEYNDRLRYNGQNLTQKNRLRLISDLRANQRFLSTKTSLVKGARDYRKKMQRLIPNVDEKDYARFWRVVEAMRRTNEHRYMQLTSKTVVKFLQAAWDASKNATETHAEFMRIFNEEYKRSNERLIGKGRPDPDKFRV